MVSTLRSDCGLRLKRAQASFGRGSSRWPSPDAQLFNDGEDPSNFQARVQRLKARGINGNGAGDTLAQAAMQWPTPAARDYRTPNSQDSQDSQDRRNKGSKRGQQLPNFVGHMWSAPQAHDAASPTAPEVREAMRAASPGLKRTAGGPSTFSNLNEQVLLWAAPTAADDDRGPTPATSRQGGTDLTTQASLWDSPCVATTEGGRKTRSGQRSDELLLNGQAEALSLFLTPHLDPETTPPGATSLTPTAKRLSPRFVEWLMGWPDGWTGYEPVGTEFTRWLARSRFELSQLASRPVEIPALQLSLFEATNG